MNNDADLASFRDWMRHKAAQYIKLKTIFNVITRMYMNLYTVFCSREAGLQVPYLHTFYRVNKRIENLIFILFLFGCSPLG